MPAGVVLFDTSARSLWVSRTAASFLGLGEEEPAIGWSTDQLLAKARQLHGEPWSPEHCPVLASLSDQGQHSAILRLDRSVSGAPNAGAQRRWFELQCRRLEMSEVPELAVLLQLVEVSEQQTSEDRARLLVDALESAQESVVITDTQIDQPGPKILYVNPGFTRLTGYLPDEVIGKTPRILQGADTDRQVIDRLRHCLEQEEVFEGETVNYRKDGSPFLMRWYVKPVYGPAGSLRNFLAVQRDVTEHRRLNKLAEAVTSTESLGYVFSGIRHELGNPVNSINAALTMLRRNLGRFSEEKTASFLDDALGEVERVSDLLRTLRGFNAHAELRLQAVEPKPLLERLARLVRNDLRSKGIQYRWSLAPATGLLRADPQALTQVLLNLVTNASQAIEADGPGQVTLHCRKQVDRVEISIRDSGPGMDAETLAHIFQPFFTNKQTGAGLGLVISRRLMAQMGGTLDIVSAPGEGTEALCSLEASDQLSAGRATKASVVTRTGPGP